MEYVGDYHFSSEEEDHGTSAARHPNVLESEEEEDELGEFFLAGFSEKNCRRTTERGRAKIARALRGRRKAKLCTVLETGDGENCAGSAGSTGRVEAGKGFASREAGSGVTSKLTSVSTFKGTLK